jgi:uncharacterized protein (DUF362 family)
MAKVVLTKTKTRCFTDADIVDTVERALNMLGFNFNDKIKNVVLKPNLCYYWNYSTGETTDPRVVSAVIDAVRRRLGNDVEISVAEADASAMKTKYAFTVLGYDKMCQTKKVNLVNLSEGAILETPVTVRGKEFTLPINELLLKADLIVNIPKLKTHNFIGATCALKNMFGAISKPRKYSYHKRISDVIVGVNKIVKSHISIVDGLIAKGSHPKKMGVIIAGDDATATDFKAARIMGFKPTSIPYLALASKEHVGQTKNIELVEDVKLSDLKKEFPNYSLSIHNISWNLQLRLLRAYASIVDDVLPPFLQK